MRDIGPSEPTAATTSRSQSARLSRRIDPIAGESLTSYLLRVAQANCVSAYDLWTYCLHAGQCAPQSSVSWRLNVVPYTRIDLSMLSSVTGVPESYLAEMTLASVLERSVNYEIPRQRLSFHGLDAGLVSRSQRYCPECLREGRHYELAWTLIGLRSCPKHRSALVDSCPTCYSRLPYLSPQMALGCCPYCHGNLASSPSIRADDGAVDLRYLLHPGTRLVPNIAGRGAASSTAIGLLWLAGARGGLPDRQLRALAKVARRVDGSEYVPLSRLLSLLRTLSTTLEEFAALQVPEPFIQQLVPRSDSVLGLACLAPWCSAYGVPGTLVRTGGRYETTARGTMLGTFCRCTKCCTDYAVDRRTGELVERGYRIELAWRVMQPLFAKRRPIRVAARLAGVSEDKAVRCLAFLCANELVPEACARFYRMPTEPAPETLSHILGDIGEGVPVARQWNAYGLGYREMLYYLETPAIRRSHLGR